MKLEPGLYDKEYNLVYTWKELILEKYMECREIGNLNTMYYFENPQKNGNLILSNTIKAIDYDSIGNELLNSIYIPSSVSNIDNYNYGIGNVCNINVSSDNMYYSSENGILFNKDKSKLIRYPFFKNDSIYKIPITVNEICERAFTGNYDIEQIICNKNLWKIHDGAFLNCKKLKLVFLNNGIKELGNMLFANCENLKTIILPKSISKINGYVFSNSPIEAKYMGSEYDFYAIEGCTYIKKPECNYKPTLEELINMGYQFREINNFFRTNDEVR